MVGLGDAARAESVASPESPIPLKGPWNISAVRDELLAEVDRFSDWLEKQDEATLARSFEYGRSVDVTTMFSVMLQHVTWHAAALHYWCKWRTTPGSPQS
jgi:hypothetical protein